MRKLLLYGFQLMWWETEVNPKLVIFRFEGVSCIIYVMKIILLS